MTEPDALPHDLDRLATLAWDALEAAAADTGHPMARATLATAGLAGGAEARIVVLREALPPGDGTPGRLSVGTDLASTKCAELAADPRATLLFWDPGRQLQLRARVTVAVARGAGLDAAWADLPPGARRNYGGQPPPGTPIPDPAAYRETEERARFARLEARVDALELLHLGPVHLRALFEHGDGRPRATWLAP